jgi:hypothetical protein
MARFVIETRREVSRFRRDGPAAARGDRQISQTRLSIPALLKEATRTLNLSASDIKRASCANNSRRMKSTEPASAD